MSTIDEQRAAHKAYRVLREEEAFDSLGPSGIPSLLMPPSPEALALLEQAGDYAIGWDAADDAIVAASDSCADVAVAPVGSTDGFLAGWCDRVKEG